MEGGLLKYATEKFLATIPACFLTFSVGQYEILFGIVFMVILDTFLGVWVALRYKRFKSSILGGLADKAGKYGVAMGSVWVIAVIEPAYFGWTFKAMGIFIILTELLSNFEKLALMGMVLPTKIISKMNKQYLSLLEDKDRAELILNERDKRR